MKNQIYCIVYSQQTALTQKVRGYLGSFAEIIPVSPGSQNLLASTLERLHPCILILDVLTPNSQSVLDEILDQYPRSVVILIGEERSQPVLAAQKKGIFAVENMDCTRLRFQNLFQSAVKYLETLQELEWMRKKLQTPTSLPPQQLNQNNSLVHCFSVRETLRTLTRFRDLESLLDSSLDWLKNFKNLGSIGIFLQEEFNGSYRLQSQIKCPREISDLSFNSHAPFVSWLKLHPSAINSHGIKEQEDYSIQSMQSQALQTFLAEALFPLHGTEGLLGWIFTGPRATGQGLTPQDVLDLSSMIDSVSLIIEKCILHQKKEAQRVHFENMLQSLPSGVVLFNEKMQIIWINSAASEMLSFSLNDLAGKEPDVLGSQLTHFIHQSFTPPYEQSTMRWNLPVSNRKFIIEAHPCLESSAFRSGYLLIQDITSEILLQENDRKLETAKAATELASQLSSGIRSPLVAIKTFIQLLPERHEDLEFRQNFINLVSHEVDRLNLLSSDIQNLMLKNHESGLEIDIGKTLRSAIHIAISRTGLQDGQVQTVIDPQPAALIGDENAILECFTQIIIAAIGDSGMDSSPAISISVAVRETEDFPSCCIIAIEGKPKNKKPGSPFQKKKGLSANQCSHFDLNLIKRTIATHKGLLRIGGHAHANHITIEFPLNQLKPT